MKYRTEYLQETHVMGVHSHVTPARASRRPEHMSETHVRGQSMQGVKKWHPAVFTPTNFPSRSTTMVSYERRGSLGAHTRQGPVYCLAKVQVKRGDNAGFPAASQDAPSREQSALHSTAGSQQVEAQPPPLPQQFLWRQPCLPVRRQGRELKALGGSFSARRQSLLLVPMAQHPSVGSAYMSILACWGK